MKYELLFNPMIHETPDLQFDTMEDLQAFFTEQEMEFDEETMTIKEVRVWDSKQQVFPPYYISVYVFGGLTDMVEKSGDLKALHRKMRDLLDEKGFDADTDDARIFSDDGTEVYSYTSIEELEDGELAEYYDAKHHRIFSDSLENHEDELLFNSFEEENDHE